MAVQKQYPQCHWKDTRIEGEYLRKNEWHLKFLIEDDRRKKAC